MGLFLDFATSLVVWTIVCVVVALIVAGVRKSGHRIRYIQIACLVALGLAVLSMIPSLIKADEHGGKAVSATRQVTDPLGRLSAADQARIKTIMGSVANDSTTFTPQVHAEFWTILDRAHMTRAEEEYMRDRFAEMAVTYQRLFYSDALTALKSGHTVKSAERRELENRLLATGEVSQQRVSANDTLIASIASGKPVSMRGGSVLFNEELIRTALNSLQTCEGRLAALFTRPSAVK